MRAFRMPGPYRRGFEGMVERELQDSRSTEFRELGAAAFQASAMPPGEATSTEAAPPAILL